MTARRIGVVLDHHHRFQRFDGSRTDVVGNRANRRACRRVDVARQRRRHERIIKVLGAP